MSNYSFSRNAAGGLESLVAWSFSFFIKGLNEAINLGYEIDPNSEVNDHFEYKFAVGLRPVAVTSQVDEKAVKQALLKYAKSLDPTTNGQKYKTIESLLEKINETSNTN